MFHILNNVLANRQLFEALVKFPVKFKLIGHILVLLFEIIAENLSYENEFDLHNNEPVGGTHFHMNGFAKGNSEMVYCATET